MIKKTMFILLVSFLCGNFVFAGELMAPEAINHFNEGVRAQQASNFETAEGHYQKALLINPNSTDLQKFILNNRGVIYAKVGDLEKAEAAFNEALRIDPNYETPKLNLGFIYEKRRSEFESMKYWLKVLNIDLDSVKPKGFVVEEPSQSE